MIRKSLLPMLAAILLFAAGAASAQEMTKIPDGVKSKVKGIILGRGGSQLILQQSDSSRVVVNMDDNTKIEMKGGVFGLHKKEAAVTFLLPGLTVEADGRGNAKGELVAASISFSSNDLKTAREIQSQTAPLAAKEAQLQKQQQALKQQQEKLKQQENKTQTLAEANAQKAAANAAAAAALKERMSLMDTYVTKYETKVYFGNNSTVLTAEDKEKLRTIAQQALNTQGYNIQVAGFASPVGNAQYNQELSQKRAAGVVQYLEEVCKVPLMRVLNPAGMGIANSGGGGDSAADQARDRRVDVKVIVNLGLQGLN